MLAFAIELTPDDNGTFLITCPDLPEVTSFAADEAEAPMRARDAIETVLQARIDDGEAIPTPRPAPPDRRVVLPALTAAKVALYGAMREQGIGKAELARRLGWHGPQVDRLLELDHASRLPQLERALAALGLQLEVQVRNAA